MILPTNTVTGGPLGISGSVMESVGGAVMVALFEIDVGGFTINCGF